MAVVLAKMRPRGVLRAARKRERWTRYFFALTSTPSSVLLVSVLSIDRVDGIEIFFGLPVGVQIYETYEVRIKCVYVCVY